MQTWNVPFRYPTIVYAAQSRWAQSFKLAVHQLTNCCSSQNTTPFTPLHSKLGINKAEKKGMKDKFSESPLFVRISVLSMQTDFPVSHENLHGLENNQQQTQETQA